MKKKKQKGLTSEQYFKDIPNKVLFIKMMGSIGQGVSYQMLDEAINEYPEHFPEEVEYRRKWASIPEEIKDKYFKATSGIFPSEEDIKLREEMFGKCPHPDIEGCGIIERVTTYADRGKDFAENDAWLSKWFKYTRKRDVDLYNELFNPYGLSRTYED